MTSSLLLPLLSFVSTVTSFLLLITVTNFTIYYIFCIGQLTVAIAAELH